MQNPSRLFGGDALMNQEKRYQQLSKPADETPKTADEAAEERQPAPLTRTATSGSNS
jgi:hypothetical protein